MAVRKANAKTHRKDIPATVFQTSLPPGKTL
jgi:hypothetical protein